MVKIAFCFHGLIGSNKLGKSWENLGGELDVLMKSYLSFRKYVLSNSKIEVDVFGHTWDAGFQDSIVGVYEPKSLVVETQREFNIPEHLPETERVKAHYSRWYSTKQSIEVMKKYATNNNIEYDLVVSTRWDIQFLKNIHFEVHDPKYFNGLTRLNRWGHPHTPKLLDLFFYSNPTWMIKFGELYDNLDEYTKHCSKPVGEHISSHHLAHWHLQKLGLVNKISLPLFLYDHYGILKPHQCDMSLVRYMENERDR